MSAFRSSALEAPRRDGHLHSCCGTAGLLLTDICSHDDRAVAYGDIGLFHQKLDLIGGLFGGVALAVLAQGLAVAADDLLICGSAADLVVADAFADHVDAHIGRRLVGGGALDLLEDRVQDREDLYVAVVVDGGLLIGLEMEGVDHVDVVKIRCRSLIGEVDGVVERQIPYREGLELGVTGLDAALVLVIELGEAGGHLAAAGTGCRDDDQRPGCLDIVVAAEALVADDQRDVGGVACDRVVAVDAQAESLEFLFVG